MTGHARLEAQRTATFRAGPIGTPRSTRRSPESALHAATDFARALSRVASTDHAQVSAAAISRLYAYAKANQARAVRLRRGQSSHIGLVLLNQPSRPDTQHIPIAAGGPPCRLGRRALDYSQHSLDVGQPSKPSK